MQRRTSTKKSVLEAFASLWETSLLPPNVFEFIKSHPDISPADLLKILLADQKYRWKAGCPLRVERYFRAYPELFCVPDTKLALIYGEFAIVRARGERPDTNAFRETYPELYEIHRRAQEGPAESPGKNRDPNAPLEYADFELGSELGRGGMSTVFRARQRSMGRDVAFKIMKEFGTSPITAFNRFVNEGYADERNRHPNIVKVHGLGRLPDGGYFLVMDLIDGPDLQRRLDADGPLAFNDVARITLAIAGAIEHAHNFGAIHRDLKPSNVLIDQAGNVFVTDFGIAALQRSGSGALAAEERFAGTPQYMAPEQADPRFGEIGPRTDVYGLGACMYAMLTGRPPFEGTDSTATITKVVSASLKPNRPSTYRPDIPPSLEQIVSKCLAKNPVLRYATAKQVADALREWSESRVA